MTSPSTQDQDVELFRTELETSVEVAAGKVGYAWPPSVIKKFTESLLNGHALHVFKSRQPHVALTSEEQACVDDWREAVRLYPNSSLASKKCAALVKIIDRLCLTKAEGG